MGKYITLSEQCTSIISDPSSSPDDKRKASLRLNTITKNIEHLKPKLTHEPKSNI